MSISTSSQTTTKGERHGDEARESEAREKAGQETGQEVAAHRNDESARERSRATLKI